RRRRSVGQLPEGLAERVLGRVTRLGLGRVGQADEVQARVLLPVPIRGQLGQAAEARFALAHGLLGAGAFGHVGVDADSASAWNPRSSDIENGSIRALLLGVMRLEAARLIDDHPHLLLAIAGPEVTSPHPSPNERFD